MARPIKEVAPPCVYRDLSDEAYQVDANGRETRIDVWLCSWPTTLTLVPQPVRRMIGGGIAIDPERDCINCPAQCASPSPKEPA